MKANAALTMGFLAAAIAALPGVASAAQPIGCLIEPDAVAEIGSPIAGVIQTVLVERGDRVTRGQVLAVLRNDVERAAVDTARTRSGAKGEEGIAIANFELARQKLARSEELMRHKFISQQAVDQAKAEYEMAEQRLAQAREQQSALANELSLAKARLEDRNIRSPIDGVVTERYVWAGERVEDKPLLRVAKVHPLRVEVVMPGSLFGTVSQGMSGRILPDTRSGVPIEAKVSLVDQVLDAASNTFRVRLRLANPDGAIPAGVRCKAELANPGVEVKSTPSTTPAARDAGPLVLKLDRDLPRSSAARKPERAPLPTQEAQRESPAARVKAARTL